MHLLKLIIFCKTVLVIISFLNKKKLINIGDNIVSSNWSNGFNGICQMAFTKVVHASCILFYILEGFLLTCWLQKIVYLLYCNLWNVFIEIYIFGDVDFYYNFTWFLTTKCVNDLYDIQKVV